MLSVNLKNPFFIIRRKRIRAVNNELPLSHHTDQIIQAINNGHKVLWIYRKGNPVHKGPQASG